MNFDPIVSDPIEPDRRFPATNQAVTFDSGGSRVLGLLHLAQGAGPHPTVILMHGIPGYERHFDLAHVLRRAGWNVLVFHPRGSWGSGGAYSLAHALEDTRAALAFLRSGRADRLDANHIVLIGHSLGAFAALTIATEDLQIRAVGALALFDLGVVARIIRTDTAGAEAMRRFFEWTMPPLHGTSPEELIKETLANGDGWSLSKKAFLLADRSLLFVTATRDTIAPGVQHTQPLLAALRASTARDWKHVELDSDHAFSDRRIALARAVLGWVERQR